MSVLKKLEKNNFLFNNQRNNIACLILILLIFILDRISKIKIINHQINNNRVYINEFINLSPNGDKVVPVFGKMFTDEPVPKDGYISLSDKPGFGVTLNNEIELEEIVFY